MSDIRYQQHGGFVAHGGGPRAEAPRDWIVWHFTPLANLSQIVSHGTIFCDDTAPKMSGSVANGDVKALRRGRIVDAPGYPAGRSVSSHVPWYIAAKSPMLYYVTRNQPPDVVDELVFLGMRLGSLVDSGLEWVASNGNAAAQVTEFSADLANLGTFVDFELLIARDWANTFDDPYRKSRRAAEILVHEQVPIELVSLVVARNEATLEGARKLLSDAGQTQVKFIHTDKLSY